MKKNISIPIILVLIFGTLLIFNYYWLNRGEDRENLPKYAQRTPRVKAAYEYALEDPELLEHIPCYCNCHRLGHKSVEDCFVSKFKEDGKVVFTEHGANCGTCYSIVLDSKELSQEGKTTQEIRDFIDNKYSRYGLPTNTPKP